MATLDVHMFRDDGESQDDFMFCFNKIIAALGKTKQQGGFAVEVLETMTSAEEASFIVHIYDTKPGN